ncbi:MAG: hypothetical protein ACXWQO_02430 [Bdellovibrionota bacterium]
MSKSAARTNAHKQGKLLLRDGSYSEAVSSFEQTVQLHGSHVGLRSDLAFAAYLAGDIGSFRRFVSGLEAEFALASPSLNEKSRILTLISLAKFQEELGRVAAALENIDSALSQLAPGHELELSVKAQKLRLFASFGREGEVAALYRDCLTVSENKPNQFFECFHALLLAEARLLGFSAAMARLQDLAKRSDLFPSALRLCAMDLLEIALETKNISGQCEILDLLPKLPGDAPDPYELELLRLAEGALPVSDEIFLQWSRIASPMSHLRLLGLESRRYNGNTTQARARLALLLEGFDHRTRQFLQLKWRDSLQSEQILELVVNEKSLSIQCGERTLRFSPRAQPWDILKVFVNSESMSPEALLQRLGKRESETELEGLRINLLRLNKKLAALAGVDWIFRYGKNGVQKNPKVKLINWPR